MCIRDSVNISGVTTATTIKSTSQLKLIAAAGNSVRIRTPNDDDNVAVFNIDDSTHLYYNSAHKFSTVSDGIRTVGNVTLFEKVIHEGDTDTFLQFTDNVINLAAGGTTGLSVQTTSVRVPTKLGINGAAPQTPLDVIANGSGYAMAIRGRSSDNTAELRFTSNDYGSLYGTIIGGPTYLKFATSGTNRWQMDSSGHLLPNTAGAVNIGSATAEIGDIFIADDKRLQLGSDQDMLVYHDNIHGYVSNRKANLYLSAPNYVQIISTDTNGSNQQTGARFLRGGKSEIFHSNSVKFETSSTGITVTGEVAASQDYPNQRPSLDLNFAATKKLDSRITYTRSGRASFINEHGLLEIVNSNVPRFDHYPVTRECKGLLIEEARTNYVIYSKMLEGWSYGVGSDVFSASSGSQLSTNPDGSSPAYHYVPSSSAGHHRYNETVTVPTLNTNYVVSVFVKRVTVGSVSNLNRYVELEVTGNFNANSAGSGQSGSNGGSHVVYDLQDLTVHPGQSDNERGYVGDAKLKAYPNDWYRLSYVFNPGSGSQFTGTIWWGHPSANTGDSGNEQGNNNPSFYFWGASVEQGSFLTSYIPTYGSTATRGGDRTYIAINDGLDFYNPVESTILVDYTHQDGVTSSNLGTKARLYRFRATGGADTRIDYVTNTGYNPYIAKDGVSPANLSHGQQTVFGGGLNRNAVRVKENSFAVSFNGSTVVEDTSGAWNPTNAIDHVTLGGFNDSFSGQLSGHIQRFTYYPVGLPNSQLVTLTS